MPPQPTERKYTARAGRGWDHFIYGWSVGWIEPLQGILSQYSTFQTCSSPFFETAKAN